MLEASCLNNRASPAVRSPLLSYLFTLSMKEVSFPQTSGIFVGLLAARSFATLFKEPCRLDLTVLDTVSLSTILLRFWAAWVGVMIVNPNWAGVGSTLPEVSIALT